MNRRVDFDDEGIVFDESERLLDHGVDGTRRAEYTVVNGRVSGVALEWHISCW